MSLYLYFDIYRNITPELIHIRIKWNAFIIRIGYFILD